jgi:ABC-type sugar transport system ATPase subunit
VVDIVEHLGDTQIAYVHVQGVKEALALKLASGGQTPANGSTIQLAIDTQHCHVFGTDGRTLALRSREAVAA